ncbi:MAG: hypothetical protein Q9M37_00245 [Desulfonauticus sp.]|nr:hypothetical protein [Desulfonauticus sp.]
MIEVKEILKDSEYYIVVFIKDKKDYIFLYDAKQKVIFLTQDTKEEIIYNLWQKHLQDKDFCIPCEFMLQFDKKVILTSDYLPLEMNISLQEMQSVFSELEAKIELPQEVKRLILSGQR